MHVNDQRFSGVLAPVITPFDAALNPDPDSYIRHCRWLIGQGAGLAVFGTNSEAASLSVAEKEGLLRGLVAAGVDPARLMPGTGACALTDAVVLSKLAVELGCNGVLMLPPFYYKGVSDDGLYAYYAEVIERVAAPGLHIYLYHIPPVSQIPLSPAVIERLVKDFPEQIVGIKDSSGDPAHLRALNTMGLPDFRVFCGSESLLLENLRQGGAGCISATANVNPTAMGQLYHNWEAEGAEDRQAGLNSVRELFQRYPMIPALKAATAHFRGDPGWRRVRPPLMTLAKKVEQELLGELRKTGFQMPDL